MYNFTLADNENGTMIEGGTVSYCGGFKLKSFIIGDSSKFCHLKLIRLQLIGLAELTVEDLVDFPDLQLLLLKYVVIEHLGNGLLCYNFNITILHYVSSYGVLTVFPRQIFNCTIPLKLEYLHLEDHNITSLPAHAFGSAAEHLRVLHLLNIGLENIQKDAFSGVVNLQLVRIQDNKLLHISGAMIPPSTGLQIIEYNDNRLNKILNLTTMQIARKGQLQMFVWIVSRISDILGSFCSDQLNSNLEVIRLQGSISSDRSISKVEQTQSTGNTSMTETLPANVFDHCISLKSLSIIYTGLTYIPNSLFSTDFSHLETLLLAGNKLNSNTSWSDVLMPLHGLKQLDLSMNMLASWTHNLSSLWSLELLDLSHNAITKISHVAFMNMTSLKFFSLEDNCIVFLAPKIQHTLARIPMMNLGSNNIYKFNMSTETILSDNIIVDITSNHLTQLDMPLERKCSQPCGKISLYADNNKLSQFVLPCSNTHQYSTVSLTNNKLTDINSLFPDIMVQQCSIGTLNVSRNHFKRWISTIQRAQYQAIMNGMFFKESQRHNITTFDMTHCGIQFIHKDAFFIYSIWFLDLRENALHTLPYLLPGMVYYPSVLDAHFNPIMCNCHMLWLKQYLNNETLKREKEIRVTNCMEPVWHTSMNIVTVPDIMFLCDSTCPQQIYQQCDKAVRCYQVMYNSLPLQTLLNAAVCSSSHNNNKLSSAFITVLYRLYISGFNLSTLKLPYVKPHSLMHLNLTSCNIGVIPKTAFINTPHLELLVLTHNAIQTIPHATFH